MILPWRAGQFVRSPKGKYGVTTDGPRTRTPRISVMWIGANYEVLEPIEDLEVIELPKLED